MKTFLKKRYAKVTCCFLAGAAVLTAAVFANYDNAGGYSVCKNALKNVLYQKNFTTNMKMEVSLDDQLLASVNIEERRAADGEPYLYTSHSSKKLTDNGSYTTSCSESWEYTDQYVNKYTDTDGEISGHVNRYINDRSSRNTSILDPDNNTEQKAIAFVEKVGDTMVGDLKNSFIQTESVDGNRTYQISLSGAQMPDWVSSGISLIVASFKDNMEDRKQFREDNPDFDAAYSEGILERKICDSIFLNSDPILDSVYGIMRVDSNDLPTYAMGKAVVTGYDSAGQEHALTFSVELNFSDIGTTHIEPADLNSIPNLSIYDSKSGQTVLQIPKDASEKQIQDLKEEAESRASDGETVVIRNANGDETVIYGRENAETTDED